MKKIFLKRVMHRDNPQLALIFEYDKDLLSIVKSISGTRFSGSRKFWYISDTEENLRKILKAFKDNALVDISAIVHSPLKDFDESSEDTPVNADFQQEDHEKSVQHTEDKKTFGEKSENNSLQGSKKNTKSAYTTVEFRINDQTGKLVIKFTGRYEKEWIEEIRTYGKLYYDKELREFVLPLNNATLDSLTEYFSTRDVDVMVIKPDVVEANNQAFHKEKSFKKVFKHDITNEFDLKQRDEINNEIPVQPDQEDSFQRPVKNKELKYSPVEFRINDPYGRLSIKFTGYYDKKWIDEIKTYGKAYYDKVHREFLLPWSKLTVDSLSDYFSTKDVEVRVIKPVVSQENKELRKSFGDEIRNRELGSGSYKALELLRKHLEESRYSVRTIESYMTLLELFFKYFYQKDPSEIRQNEVSEFMNDFIIKNGFSKSYQNQMISAIKMYYEISGNGKIVPFILERPRRGRALPKVFSKEEIILILNSTRNNKHKLLLWIIYSCGLRRSEVTNIKLADIDRDRNILHIREGKGGVDRIVPVSDKVWQKIDEYIEGYRPRHYLFEGQSGGRYSSESVYNVFKQSLTRAGIKKEVGVHSLRHSYATHLHENGVDIRYIQELLGHKSTRTTEIYTHVSRRNLAAVRSPIEDLDLK